MFHAIPKIDVVLVNFAALRAAILLLFAKTLRRGVDTRAPSVRGLSVLKHACERHIFAFRICAAWKCAAWEQRILCSKSL